MTPCAVSPTSTAAAIYCHSIGCEDLQRYTFHPWSEEAKRRRQDCLCLWLQNEAKSSSLTSTWKLCRYLHDWFYNCEVEMRSRRWGGRGSQEELRLSVLVWLDRLVWLSRLQLIPQLLFGFLIKQFMFSAMSTCLSVGWLVGWYVSRITPNLPKGFPQDLNGECATGWIKSSDNSLKVQYSVLGV